MSGPSPREWLAQEVEELLSVGLVGLYEFPEILQNSEFTLDEASTLATSKDVAEAVIAQSLATICLLRWPSADIIDGPISVSVLDEPASWGWLPSRLYFALVPRDEGASSGEDRDD